MANYLFEILKPEWIHDIGQRANNEDSIYPFDGNATSKDRLFLVCDGVGGSSKGEVASQMVCTHFSDYLLKNQSEVISSQLLFDALKHTEAMLSAHVEENNSCKGMKTTLTMLWLREEGAWITWCGDSRVYQFRNGRIIYKTTDHSLVNKLIEEGQLTQEEAENHPHSNVILRAIAGSNEPTEVDWVLLKDFAPGDIFLLCSDGITEKLTDTNLSELASLGDTEMMADQIKIFCDNFSKDNFSAYLIGLQDARQITHVEEVVVAPEIISSPEPEVIVKKQENNFVKYALGALAFLALMIGIFSFFQNNKKKEISNLIQEANQFQRNGQLDSARLKLEEVLVKQPDNMEIKEDIEKIRSLKSIRKTKDSLARVVKEKELFWKKEMAGIKNDTSTTDSLKTLQLINLSLKRNITDGFEYLNKEDTLKAFQLLKWKDTIPYVQYQYSELEWKNMADLYQKYAQEDTLFEDRKSFCLEKANIQIEKNE